MQTFLPYVDPLLVGDVLDQKRLGKQRVEGNQILDLLEGRADNNWKYHPATRMWTGYETALKFYINVMITNWIERGRENNMPYHDATGPMAWPPWMRDPRLVYSHRANLVRKDPEYYGPIWPDVEPDTPYWWPVELRTKKKQDELDYFWGMHHCEIVGDAHINDAQIIMTEGAPYEFGHQSWHYSYN